MDEGRIVAWHKRVGDAVVAGEVLFEVETDKATMEVESPAAGTLRRILFAADSSAPVATVIALISDTADEPLSETLMALTPQPPKPSLPGGSPARRCAPRGPYPCPRNLSPSLHPIQIASALHRRLANALRSWESTSQRFVALVPAGG